MSQDLTRYLARIGWSSPVSLTRATLAALQLAHLDAITLEPAIEPALEPEASSTRPDPISDPATVIDQLVRRGSGANRIELNAGFAQLIEALGFGVRYLGAAVLLEGPATIIDHLVLEVEAGEPYLVDVGFADHGLTAPIPLGRSGPQPVGADTFELIGSPQGATLTRHIQGIPQALYRFKRVDLELADFPGFATSKRQSDEPGTNPAAKAT